MSAPEIYVEKRPIRGAVWALVLGAVSLLLFIGLTVGYTTYSVRHSQGEWCATLALLTAHPVPNPGPSAAAKNPSREDAYILYKNFVTLSKDFGCKA